MYRFQWGGCEIVTRNALGTSVKEDFRNRMMKVVDRIARKGWEMVCLTELRAED